ncbi:DEAD-box ATP-dependent RNA helicase [Vigna angularis]|uniref:ATP-dependent RNA helicase n=1 Tax=Phaseolus angularis TaxID=3914 RepID=A0A8T0KHS5_PHAAN|nr:DEAD-box ATP-dependent RNA helicase [Vigna angularis]
MGVKKLSQGVKNEGNGSNDNVFASCSFSSLGLDSNLCEQLHERLGFEVPTLVQAQAIPVILSGRHALVNAATGTGKTAAYLAPIVHLLQGYENRIQRSDGTFGYIMGGENRSKEKARLRKGISILIATPGRLLDHLKNTTSFLHLNLRWIIFDEADRILELGFGKDIEEILDLLGSRKTMHDDPKNTVTRNSKIQRQNLLLSATLNEKVNHLAKISLDNPVMVGLDDKKIAQISTAVSNDHSESDGDNEDQYSSKMPTVGDYKVPVQLIQRYMKVPCGSRLPVLLSIIKHLFEREPSQKEDRRTSFQTFKTEKSALLLSSDVSARGLDFPKVRCIIQYDSPGEATEYVHRVGRTARLGEKGESLLFLQPVEIDYLQDLEKHGVSLTEYPILKVLDSFPLYGQKNYTKKSVFLDSHPWVLCLQKALEAFIMSKAEVDKLAKKAFCSWVRAYTAHRGELKRIFMIKKLHLGHVAKSFALKQQPSLVGQSFQKQAKKRKRFERKTGVSKKRKVGSVTERRP